MFREGWKNSAHHNKTNIRYFANIYNLLVEIARL